MLMKPLGRLILWTGKKHSGKTTSASKLVSRIRREGYRVCGLLAPSIYEDGVLVGFDAVDVKTGMGGTLAKRCLDGGTGGFTFLQEGLEVGKQALNARVLEGADFVVIDEFGPIELSGSGWRAEADRVLESGEAVLMLVVRSELADDVRGLYKEHVLEQFAANESASVERVLAMLQRRR